jgi:hypothetical protein
MKTMIQERLSGTIISEGRQSKVREHSVKLSFNPVSIAAY